MSDLEVLQGKWQVVALEVSGMTMPEAMLAAARIELDGERFVSRGMGADYEGRLELNEGAMPRRFSLTFDVGPEAGRCNNGIYELTDEIWRMCLDMAGGPTPDAFIAPTERPTLALQTLRRVG